MSRTAEVATALYGAFKLARFDASGLTYFDTSLNGYWRSFFAAVLVAPLYAAMMALRMSFIDVGNGAIIIDILAYAINWMAFPVVMLNISALLDRRQHYQRHIVAYNWAAVIQNAIYLPLAMLVLSGILPTEVGALISLMVLGWVLVYSGYIAHIALDIPLGTAAALVVIDLVIGVIINGLAAGAIR